MSDPKLGEAFASEIRGARAARTAGADTSEWRHLERAHIISQPSVQLHVRSHVHMLGFAIRHPDGRELVGQLLRLAVAAPASATRRYPAGNTGGANVPATRPMEIPEDLRSLLAPYQKAVS
jgi:hypothetical protein